MTSECPRLCHHQGVTTPSLHTDFPPWLPADPATLAEAVLDADRRVLLAGPPGVGKSTLVDALASELARAGRICRCLGADPGSPLFAPQDSV